MGDLMPGRLSENQVACLQRLAGVGGDGWVLSTIDGGRGTVVGTTATSLHGRGLVERQAFPKQTRYRITETGRAELEAAAERLRKRAVRQAARLTRNVAGTR
jgi:hypothetical protein